MPYGDLLADVVQGSTANTPPVFKDGNSTEIGTLCRAWVNFNGTGTVAIRASFNVSSITDNGTGDYTVNFTTAMPDANYAGTCSSAQDAAGNRNVYGNFPYAQVPTTTTARIATVSGNNASLFDAQYIGFAFFR
jgi:hypothetical protein